MPTILIVDDDAALRDSLAETVHDLGHQAKLAASGREALAIFASDEIDGVLLDLRMPSGMDGIEVLRRIRAQQNGPPVVVLTAFASAENTIEAMRIGALDHLTKPIGRQELRELLARMLAWPSATPSGVPSDAAVGTLIGSSEPMRRVQKTIGLTADSDTTVLILGETGTGKELVARALHEHGRRKHKPFVAVNCAAIPADLLESELFGHMKGAFTGAAADRAGAFREADGGTLFLDEIGDLNASTAVKLLRVLQEREFDRLGGTRTVKTDVRLIVATNKDLEKAIAAGTFREDIYYRLNVFAIFVPPLRERKSDVLLLADHFLEKYSNLHGKDIKRISTPAIDMLIRYHWPGNIRELENTVERAVLVCDNNVIHAHHLPPTLQTAEASGTVTTISFKEAVEAYEKDLIQDTLKTSRGNRSKAARLLKTTDRVIGYKIKKLNIDSNRFRD